MKKPARERGAWIGALGSLAVHLIAVVYGMHATERAALGVEFTVPIDVQFGLADAMRVEAAPRAEEPEAESEATTGTAGANFDGGVPSADGGHDAATDAARRRARRDGGPRVRGDGGRGESQAQGDSGRFGAYAPPGAQIAIRLDLEKVRASPLSEDVRLLLAAIPDWRLLLNGSGIDPLEDLDRLMLATPNLRRETFVIAGTYRGGADRVRAAVASMAEARGAPADWREESGIPVAPWRNEDETERVLALVGPSEFTISRPQDLPRVIAVARARRARLAQQAHAPTSDSEGLLALEEGEVLALDVEGARNYIRGAAVVPKQIHVAIRQEDASHVHVVADATFDNAEEAGRAHEFWSERRESLAGDFGVRIAGFSQPVAEALLVQAGDSLHAEMILHNDQVRFLLGLLRGVFEPPPAPVAAPVPPMEFPPPEAPAPPIGAVPTETPPAP